MTTERWTVSEDGIEPALLLCDGVVAGVFHQPWGLPVARRAAAALNGGHPDPAEASVWITDGTVRALGEREAVEAIEAVIKERDALRAEVARLNDATTDEWEAQLRYVIAVRDERAPSDIDIEAGTNDAPWWLQLRDAIDGLDDIWRRANGGHPDSATTERCAKCGGTGWWTPHSHATDSEPCPDCKGRGRIAVRPDPATTQPTAALLSVVRRLLGDGTRTSDDYKLVWHPEVDGSLAYPARTWVPVDVTGTRVGDIDTEPMTDAEVAAIGAALTRDAADTASEGWTVCPCGGRTHPSHPCDHSDGPAADTASECACPRVPSCPGCRLGARHERRCPDAADHRCDGAADTASEPLQQCPHGYTAENPHACAYWMDQ